MWSTIRYGSGGVAAMDKQTPHNWRHTPSSGRRRKLVLVSKKPRAISLSFLESLMGRETTTSFHCERWFAGCMKAATLIGGMRGWRDSWRLSPSEALYSFPHRSDTAPKPWKDEWIARGFGNESNDRGLFRLRYKGMWHELPPLISKEIMNRAQRLITINFENT